MNMKGRTFVKKIFVKYKWLLIALLMISIIAIPMVVNILFKFSSAFPAEWSAGDALSYVSGLQALLGTIILGIITVEQGQDAQEVNRRLSEENNRLQKIMSQKLLPAVKLTNPSCKPTMLIAEHCPMCHSPNSSELFGLIMEIPYNMKPVRFE